MKTTLVVLFTIFSLVGCLPKSQPPSPPVFPSQPASQETPWPNVEYNRATMVWVEYEVLEIWSTPEINSFIIPGTVVAPRTIISQRRFAIHDKSIKVQKITIRSVADDWSGIPAVIVAEIEIGRDIGGGVVLLSADSDLPNTRPAVFGGVPSCGQKAEGYYFASDDYARSWYNMNTVTPALVKFSDNGQECYPSDQSSPNGSDAGHITFNKNHRLVCVSWASSAKVKRFLRANKIPFLEK